MIYRDVPEDFKKVMDVVACFVEHEGRFLLLQRSREESYPGTWGLPGGKVDDGETIPEAMRRELEEETGMRLAQEALRRFDSVHVRHGVNDFEYHMYTTRIHALPEVRLEPSEHQTCAWVTPPEAKRMDLIDDLSECIDLFFSVHV